MLRRRVAALLVGTAVSVVSLAGAASAHVTVNPREAPKGGYAKLTFRVPTEKADASTVKIQVVFPEPTAAVLPSASVQPRAGWSYKVDTTHLATPIESDDGPVSDIVSQITWTADSSANAIKPGEFDEFNISVGPLPTKVDSLTFKALQTYSNGEVVSWIEASAPGAAAPQHPAPVLRLTDPVATTAASAVSSSTTDDAVRIMSIAALVVATAALVAIVVSLRRKDRPVA